MKTGRNVHVPKTDQMKRNYRRYIGVQDYQPTVDESLDFEETNQSGEDLSSIDTLKKRPIDPGEKIRDHFSNNWLVWVLCALSAGIVYLVFDSKVAFTRYETILTTQSEKLNDIKSTENDLAKNDHLQDLKIQENKMLLDHMKKDISDTKTMVYELSISQQNAAADPGD